MSSWQLIPSLLVDTADEFKQRLMLCEGVVSFAQVDVLRSDGFTPNQSWADPIEIAQWNFSTSLELHLMVDDPEQELSAWSLVPQVKRAYVHVESTRLDPHRSRQIMDANGWERGVAFTLGTNPKNVAHIISVLEPSAAIIMGIENVGYSGQEAEMTKAAELLAAVRATFPESQNWSFTIDGGAKPEILDQLRDQGFTNIVVGSAIWDTEDPVATMKSIQAQ